MKKGFTHTLSEPLREARKIPTVQRVSGFTLIEIIFVIALSLVLFLAIHSLYRSFSSLSDKESASYFARTSAGGVIRSAESIVLPASRILSSHAFSIGTYSSNSDALVVEMPAVEADGDIIAGAYDYAVIFQSGASVSMRIEASASSTRKTRQRVLGTSFTDLSFTYNNADVTNATSVTVSASVAVSERHETSTLTLEETLRARNLSL